MDQNWEACMSLGIVHFMAFPECIKGDGPLYESIERIVTDDFFSAIEITRINDPGTRRRVRSLLEASGVDVAFGAQPVLLANQFNLNSFAEEERRRAVEEMKRCVQEAYEVNAKGMAVLSGRDPGDADRERALELCADSLKQLCRHATALAKDYELGIVLEVFDRSVDKKCLIGPTPEAVLVADMVKGEVSNFGLMVDLSHVPLIGETPAECIPACIHHLVHVHAGNCVMRDTSHPAYGDNHPRFGVAGGENDVGELVDYLKVLFDAGYFEKRLAARRPIFSFEVKPMANETSDVIIANTKRVWREAWARLMKKETQR